jgi:hypothetical protein
MSDIIIEFFKQANLDQLFALGKQWAGFLQQQAETRTNQIKA